MAKSAYIWFVQPMDKDTNDVVGRQCHEDDFCHEIRCEDGECRDLWKCTREVMSALVASRRTMRLKFKVFCQAREGKIRDVSFLFLKKRKNPIHSGGKS